SNTARNRKLAVKKKASIDQRIVAVALNDQNQTNGSPDMK
ncbi:unnamed protein product, partial [marine sediment metagenome]